MVAFSARSLYHRPSFVRLSSVCNIRAPYSGDWNIRECFYAMGRWPSADIQVQFYGDRPMGTPPSGELNTRGVAKYSDVWTYRTLYLGNGAR